MPDHATSTSPAVQRQLDRLWLRSPGADILGLERITELLARLDNPHLHLPPVFHVAGTNGKGSTCAFLRAAIEGAGLACHVYTSPHLVRFNERIRLAGTLIADDALAPLLAEVLDAGEDIGASFFEVTTAAAFLAFARTPAEACVIEVGLGGRLDATNVIENPAICGIAQLGVDHESFLGADPVGIAREKAGIAKPGRPLVISHYPKQIADAIRTVAAATGAHAIEDWRYTAQDRLEYRDTLGVVVTPLPTLAGAHQNANLALAIAMLRHQDRVDVPDAAIAAAAIGARWPARMQRLASGPLPDILPDPSEIWLDGGHNAAAGQAVADALADIVAAADAGFPPPQVHLIVGMLVNKDPVGLLAPIAPLVSGVIAIPVPGHDHHAPVELARTAHRLGVRSTVTTTDAASALHHISDHTRPGDVRLVVLILGSLYLAGAILAANGEPPD